jgi:hypothetical protein
VAQEEIATTPTIAVTIASLPFMLEHSRVRPEMANLTVASHKPRLLAMPNAASPAELRSSLAHFNRIALDPVPEPRPLIGGAGVSGKQGFPTVPVSEDSGVSGNPAEPVGWHAIGTCERAPKAGTFKVER